MSTEELLKQIFDEVKLVRKDIRKLKTILEDPQGEKAKARSTTNGFNKPLDVSEELRTFLKLAPGEQISRSQVTKKINEYVTEKGLKAGQHISMDASLRSILDPPADVQVTFLNIQKYINKHYVKNEPAVKEDKPAEAAPKAKRPTVKKAAV